MIKKTRTSFGDSEIAYGGEDLGSCENYPQGVLIFDQIKILRQKIDWLVSSLSSKPTISDILKHLLQGSACAVSNESFYPITKIGLCVWMISIPDRTECI